MSRLLHHHPRLPCATAAGEPLHIIVTREGVVPMSRMNDRYLDLQALPDYGDGRADRRMFSRQRPGERTGDPLQAYLLGWTDQQIDWVRDAEAAA